MDFRQRLLSELNLKHKDDAKDLMAHYLTDNMKLYKRHNFLLYRTIKILLGSFTNRSGQQSATMRKRETILILYQKEIKLEQK